MTTTSARTRSAFGQFQLNRSGIDIGVDYTKVERLSTFDMAQMLRDGATLAEVGHAVGRSKSCIVGRLVDAGWSSRDGQPIRSQADPDPDSELTPGAPARIPQYQIEFVDQPWAEQALCAQTDPELFFPEKGGSVREAKEICARCFVAAECLDYALTTGERFGVWGGFSERERRKLQGNDVPCPQCDDLFATEGNRDRHAELRHRPPKNPVACSDCGRIFAHSGAMFGHTKAAHPMTERTPTVPTIKVLLIPADTGQPLTWADVDLGADSGLAAFQHLVGGQVQVVPLNVPGTDLWCNEDTTGLNLASNIRATTLYHAAGGMPWADVKGDTFITGGADDEGETLGLSPEQADQLHVPTPVPS